MSHLEAVPRVRLDPSLQNSLVARRRFSLVVRNFVVRNFCGPEILLEILWSGNRGPEQKKNIPVLVLVCDILLLACSSCPVSDPISAKYQNRSACRRYVKVQRSLGLNWYFVPRDWFSSFRCGSGRLDIQP